MTRHPIAYLRRVVRAMRRLMDRGHSRADAKRIAAAVVERAVAEVRPEPTPRRRRQMSGETREYLDHRNRSTRR